MTSGFTNSSREDYKSYSSFFSSITDEQIQDAINYLQRNLPQKSTKNNYQLCHEMLHADTKHVDDLQPQLQITADLMREHLIIAEPIRILLLDNVAAGKFQMIDGLCCIFINSSTEKQNFYQKIAILAHEMSHYYLMRKHNIELRGEQENEFITEINAIYVGFGLLLLKGYEGQVKYENRVNTILKVGYIDLPTVRTAIIQTAYARKQKPQWIVKNVDIFNKLYFYIKLYKLFKDYKKSIKTNAGTKWSM